MNLLFALLLQTHAAALDNEYVRVTRDAAPCASARLPGCGGDRVIVALGDFEIRSDSVTVTKLQRGGVVVFEAGKTYVQTVKTDQTTTIPGQGEMLILPALSGGACQAR